MLLIPVFPVDPFVSVATIPGLTELIIILFNRFLFVKF